MTSTERLTLAGFLLVRIAEDEEAARMAGKAPWAFGNKTSGFWIRVDGAGSVINVDGGISMRGVGRHMMRWQPARVLAECEAKRRIVELLDVPDPHERGEHCLDCQTLQLLALPYADHPDFRAEWRP